ncbi:MAG: Glutamine amidotransferase, class [Oscillospiraceae bacterium]|nr:Glutamine amidotransferase, class [Oscillospiraceae bacterium]
MKPRILVSVGENSRFNYERAVEAAGGEPISRYCPTLDAGYDGLLLCGGGDIDPSFFGQENLGSNAIDRKRDLAELALVEAFCGGGRPVLGICRGHQVMNVALGGTLIQALNSTVVSFHQQEHGDILHILRCEPGSLLHQLYDLPLFPVNSNHHQALDLLGGGLYPIQWSESGIVEAIVHSSLPLLGVQWHPERMTGDLQRTDTVEGGRIFDWFIKLCRGEVSYGRQLA